MLASVTEASTLPWSAPAIAANFTTGDACCCSAGASSVLPLYSPSITSVGVTIEPIQRAGARAAYSASGRSPGKQPSAPSCHGSATGPNANTARNRSVLTAASSAGVQRPHRDAMLDERPGRPRIAKRTRIRIGSAGADHVGHRSGDRSRKIGKRDPGRDRHGP